MSPRYRSRVSNGARNAAARDSSEATAEQIDQEMRKLLDDAYQLARRALLADRGKFFKSPWTAQLMATVHPSSLLRIIEEADRHREYERFVMDLQGVAEKLRDIG